MPRKGPVPKRDVLPDPLYNSKLVTRLINRIMIDGKRGVAQTILYDAFTLINERTVTGERYNAQNAGEVDTETFAGPAR